MKITERSTIQLELTADQARRVAEALDNGQAALKLPPLEMKDLRDRNFQEWLELHDTIRDASSLAAALYAAHETISGSTPNDWLVTLDQRRTT